MMCVEHLLRVGGADVRLVDGQGYDVLGVVERSEGGNGGKGGQTSGGRVCEASGGRQETREGEGGETTRRGEERARSRSTDAVTQQCRKVR